MRIISYNVNGLRAAMNKGFVDWLKTDPADVICLQETKALRDNVDHKLFTALGYNDYWFPAQKKGWSKAAKGAVIGAAGGAAAGAIINKRNRAVGAAIGGVLGAGVGFGIGRHIDKKDGRY